MAELTTLEISLIIGLILLKITVAIIIILVKKRKRGDKLNFNRKEN